MNGKTLRGAVIGIALAAQGAIAQDTTSRAPTRPVYNNLAELTGALPVVAAPTFDDLRALWLAAFPLACLDRLQPRPGRPAQGPATQQAAAPRTDSATAGAAATAGAQRPFTGAEYFWVASYRLIPRYNRTRAFWGCTDWHSAASSTWVTASLLKTFPALPLQELGREKLAAHLGATNLQGELDFFRTSAGNFERPYGYAWLLKLQSTLRTWPDSQARRWARNTTPLANWMADSLVAHMNALPRPVRTGSQANSALSLLLALDYAEATANAPLRSAIGRTARRFFLDDKDCNTLAEAGAAGARARPATGDSTRRNAAGDSSRRNAAGDSTRAPARPSAGPPVTGANDLLSPCLIEAALMARVLERPNFASWLDSFLPPLHSARFAPLTEAYGGNATANERARLSALAFQRAYAMERIAKALAPTDARVAVFRRLSAIHADRGVQLLGEDTAGTNWVPAFGLLYFEARN